MPNWRKVIVSGSDASLYSLNVTNGITGSLFGTASYTLTASYVNPLHQIVEITSSTTAASLLGSGSGLFTVDGTRGRIFTINDTNSGSLFSVVTGSWPIFEVFSSKLAVVSGSLNVSSGITGSLYGTASWAISSSNALTASYVSGSSNSSISSSYALSSSYAETSSYSFAFADQGFKYTQSPGSTTWTIVHNLNTLTPLVDVYDSSYNQLIPAGILSVDVNTTQITFSTVQAGYAIISKGSGINSETAISASFATSASYAISASFAPGSGTSVSASYAATASSADNFVIRNSLTASGLFYPATDGAYEFQVLQTNASGNLSFGDVSTTFDNIYNGEATALIKGTPVYISGSNGANPKVYRADAANASKMPVVYIVSEEITSGNVGRGITLGEINGIDLTGYTAGTSVYVAAGGGWTSTRPTGSNVTIQFLGLVTKEGSGGKGLVLNPGPATLPNIQTGYTWIGNGNSYPLAVSTSSLLVTSASYAMSSSATLQAQTASHADTFTIGGAELNYSTIPSTSAGNNGIFATNTGSYSSAFYQYTIFKGSNARTDSTMAVWTSTTSSYTNYSTIDIGSTVGVEATVDFVGNQVQLNVLTPTSGWTVKAMVTFL